jgi:TRAP-type C4-dicarboxylate transport system permease small subunit
MRHVKQELSVNIVARLAIIFAGIIAAGVFLNLYMFAASLVLIPTSESLGIKPSKAFALAYWPCLAAGVVTAFFVVRPLWRSVGKKSVPKSEGEPPTQISN